MKRERRVVGRQMKRGGAGHDAPAREVAIRAKLFANGRSQAVRLPKEFRMPGREVLIRRHGNQLVLQPLGADGIPIGFWEEIDRLNERLDFPDPDPIGAKLLDIRGGR